jgi:hypothetical protein
MSKTKCPAGCGKLFISTEHAKSHADLVHSDWMTPRQKGWVTPYGFGDWSYPITYEQACEEMKAMSEDMFKKLKKKD